MQLTQKGSIIRALVVLCPIFMLAACGSATVTHNEGTDPPTSDNPGDGTTSPPGGLDPPTPEPTPVTEVTLTGVVTFDRVPFKETAGDGLDYAATTQSPARGIPLEILNITSGGTLGTVTTDATGTYSLVVPANITVQIRVKAEMGNVHVLDNTNGDTQYEYLTSQFSTEALEPRTRNVNVPSGWDGAAYSQPRVAAPFAILDDIYNAQQFIVTNVGATTYPDLNVYWSVDNTDDRAEEDFDDDRVNGLIDTTQYATEFINELPYTDHPGIYVLGDADNDTDEYDTDVIIGQWFYFYLKTFSRDDTMYGTFEDKLDLRSAYSQGWAFAFPLMVKGSSVYRDSKGAGQSTSDDADAEDNAVTNAGYYNPTSIASILYDLWDTNDEGSDTGNLPFSTLNTVLAQDMPNTAAMTSIYAFTHALVTREPGATAQVTSLLTAQSILLTDDFGTGETNTGGIAASLPIYTDIEADDDDHDIRSIGDPDNYYNALGNRRYFRFSLDTAREPTNIRARMQPTGTGRDPDIILWRNGQIVASATDDSSGTGTQILEVDLPAGEYVIEVYDSLNVYPDDPDTETGDTQLRVRIRDP